MNFSRKNISCIKTTILGLIIIASSFAYLFSVENISETIFIFLFITGVSFIYLPDTLINSLRDFIMKNKNKEI